MSPISTGNLSFRHYKVIDQLPPDFAQKFPEAIEKFWFREINTRQGEDLACGWVNPRNILHASFDWEQILMRPYILLGLRRDRISINKSVFKARRSQKIEELIRDEGITKITKNQKTAIEEEIKAKMLADQTPTTQVFEWAWNINNGRLWFASSSDTINLIFLDLFAETFGLEIIPALPFTLAEQHCHSKGKEGLPEDLWPAQFSPIGANTLEEAMTDIGG